MTDLVPVVTPTQKAPEDRRPCWVIFESYDAVRFWFEPQQTHSMNFATYSAAFVTYGTGEKAWEIFYDNESYNFDEVTQEMAEIRGSVKWDGCVNWESNPDCMVHGCSPSHAKNLANIFNSVYTIAKRHFDLLGDEVEPLADGSLFFYEDDLV